MCLLNQFCLIDFLEPTDEFTRVVEATITNAIDEYGYIALVNPPSCLQSIHVFIDITMMLVEKQYPEVDYIKYVVTFDPDEVQFCFVGCNRYTQKLTKKLEQVRSNEMWIAI